MDIQRQIEEGKIRKAKYNRRYKEIRKYLDNPRYLLDKSMDRITVGDEGRALIKIRCCNMEKVNKY